MSILTNSLGISTKRFNKIHIIKIDLSNREDKVAVCQILEDLNIDYRHSLKGKETETTNLANRFTELVIRDIPFGTSKEDLHKKLFLWGEINCINLVVNSS
jgi:hypothetical protein